LSASQQRLVASPLLLADRAAPVQPEDLANWPSLAHGALTDKHTWRLSATDGRQVEQAQNSRWVTNDMLTLRGYVHRRLTLDTLVRNQRGEMVAEVEAMVEFPAESLMKPLESRHENRLVWLYLLI
jgi:hypothetical protein